MPTRASQAKLRVCGQTTRSARNRIHPLATNPRSQCPALHQSHGADGMRVQRKDVLEVAPDGAGQTDELSADLHFHLWGAHPDAGVLSTGGGETRSGGYRSAAQRSITPAGLVVSSTHRQVRLELELPLIPVAPGAAAFVPL
jgi:hypothetical protein